MAKVTKKSTSNEKVNTAKKTVSGKTVKKEKPVDKKKKIMIRKVYTDHAETKVPAEHIVDLKPAELSDESESFFNENFSNNDQIIEIPKHRFNLGKKEKMVDEEEKEEKILQDRPLNLYRKISVSFIILTGLLLAVIFYFSFVNVKITIVPKEETINNNLIADIYGEGGSVTKDGAIAGVVKQVEVEQSKAFAATGREVTGESVSGSVIIYNNYNKSQPLVATTRLLTPDNKLFRLKSTVTVPANGTVDAEVYADDTSLKTDVAPTKFTIPGLWAGLQDKIYAESKEPIKFQEKVQMFIEQSDIDKAVANLKQESIKKAEEQNGELRTKYSQVLYKVDENSIVTEVDSKSGEQKESFNVKLKAKVVVVAFNDDAIKNLAEKQLAASLTENQQLLKTNRDQISYDLSNYDLAAGTASVNASFDGQAVIKNDSIIDKEKLVGLTKEQLQSYLESLPELENFTIEFNPSFIKTVPSLVDRINIELR
ncbi:MAG: hypothetical protein UT48_C0023G0011 [Parcubacteria group bacterium GW2011_GWE2_39_37]|nr:MAG: hypothetical protein UT48_C0023G0011 [Parcubacteria group bacterium GW2011_GWE2_39_37]